MKKLSKIIVVLLLVSISIPIFMVSAMPRMSTNQDFRGLWVATVLNIDYPSKPTVDAEILKNEAVKILDHAENMGINALILQVRPTSDSLYKSGYFPWSKYLTGAQGTAPDNDFDPLEFWVNEAHSRGMELHAWINPYRVTKRESGEPKYDFASLAPSNPANLHPEWVVKYSDGNLYFDPGIPEVRSLIINSTMEILNHYDVDGIHFDDYFYPGKDFGDKATYEKYGKSYGNIDDWRRENVNILIGDLSKAIKAQNKNVRFGISPFGIWANSKNNPLGSATNGTQSYYDHYADTRKWVKEKNIDYIAPQLYWNIGYSIADYSKLLTWWKSAVSGTGVDLYIGQAAYRSGNPDKASPWYGVSEIEKQLKLNAKTPEVKGSIFYNYKSLADSPALSAVIKAYYEQRDGIAPGIPVGISRPAANISTSFSKFYLNGSSDPEKPLYLNGELVKNRSAAGYFGVLVTLSQGENIFTVSQEGSYMTRVVYRETASSEPQKMSSAGIPSDSVFPQSTEYRTSGEKITLVCKAPIGSKVTVKIGGKSYNMKPASTASYGTGAYPTTFSYVYTIPKYTGTPRNIDLGAPVYTMNYKGSVKTRTAPAKVGVIMKNSPYYARMTKDTADTYGTPSSSNGAAFQLYKGMTDYVTGMTGSYVRLSSGQWIKKANVETYTSKTQLRPSIKKATYKKGDKWDVISFDISSPAAAIADFDGNTVSLDVSAAVSAVKPALPANSLFSSVTVSKKDNGVRYVFKPKNNQRIEGYYIEKTSGGLTLNIKRPVSAKGGNTPLAGIAIMLDPGHGGSESGAIGPLGIDYAEKNINLKTALKVKNELEKLGARVAMTRTSDKTVSLEARLAASRKEKPDMFISLHANSMEDNVDMNQVKGLSVYYREALAGKAAGTVLNDVITKLNRNNQGSHIRNFYVIRGTWTPSILVETGFVPNPNEFEWLIDENGQSALAAAISESVVSYFRNK